MKPNVNYILYSTLGLALIVMAVASYAFFNMQTSMQTEQSRDLQTQSPTAAEEQVGIPINISIPKIGVKADITLAGLDENGAVEVPKGPNGVTWYKDGAKPGEKGSAVITGHYGPWLSGAKSVFDNLHDLVPGDKIYIKDNRGKTFTFEVRDKKTYTLGQMVPEVFNKYDKAYLNLVTCSGQWLANQKTFTNRLVVFTEHIE